jgi:glycosyltransferase involved in cell wall biosynthesis
MDEQSIMDKALVSVILPVFNGGLLLAEAIKSVLKQDYRPIEIILVDDGSTDPTAVIASEFSKQVQYVYQPNAGPAAARNLGIRMARGEYIAFIDADDLWPSDKLHMQMNCFETYPTVEIVQGLISRIGIQNLVQGQIVGADIDFPFIYTNLGSMVIRRSVFEKIGNFEEGLRFHEDTDFWLRAREKGIQILIQRKIALIYRIHGHNLTTGKDVESTGFLSILWKSINRRRISSGAVINIGKLKFIPDLKDINQPSCDHKKKELMAWPLVSIILYANGNLATVCQAIDSIRSQDYHPVELLIIGDLLDQVRGLIDEPFSQVHFMDGYSDLASGLNAALQRSNGEIIAFLDAEGIWAPEKLKTQVAFLLEHPADGYVVGRTRNIILPDLKYPADLIDEFSLRKTLGDLLSTLAVRRSVVDQVGEFSPELAGMAETDWLLRAKDKGFHQQTLPNVWLFRFIQPDFHVVGIDKMKAALLESVRSSVHRKRNLA